MPGYRLHFQNEKNVDLFPNLCYTYPASVTFTCDKEPPLPRSWRSWPRNPAVCAAWCSGAKNPL